MGVQLDVESETHAVHWVPVPAKPRERNIVVRFTNRRKRDAFMQAVKEKNKTDNKLTTLSIGYRHSVPIFVNDHLTPTRKRLLGMAIAKKRQVNWAFVWTDSNGTIYARKSPQDRAVVIESSTDVDKIC